MVPEDASLAHALSTLYAVATPETPATDHRTCWTRALGACASYVGATEVRMTIRHTAAPHLTHEIHTLRPEAAGSPSPSRPPRASAVTERASLSLDVAVDDVRSGTLTFLLDGTDAERVATAKARMHALHEHVERVLRVDHGVRDSLQRHGAVIGLVDRMAIGLLILDDRGRVRFVNRFATEVLARLDQLELVDGVLECLDPDVGFADAVSRLCREGPAAVPTRLSLSPDGGSDGRILLEMEHYLPDDAPPGSKGCALVTLIDSRVPYAPDAERLASLFDLSAAETSVCALMLDGLTNREIAAQRCVGSETVRSQVTSVLRKMRVSRRMHLFRLVATTSPSLWQ